MLPPTIASVLASSAKDAAANIEKAINEHGYSKPDGYLFLSNALLHQARYQDAASKANVYLAKIEGDREAANSRGG